MSDVLSPPGQRYFLRFKALFDPGRSLCFPCDAQGRIALDELSDRARSNYLFARAVVGREVSTPIVERAQAA